MAVKADCHLHTHHSADTDTPMEAMIERAIELSLDTVCFTEHNDFGFPESYELPGKVWELNADSYLYELLEMREKYKDKIRVLFGVEIGLQPQYMRENAIFAKAHEYDFIIGSTHLVDGKDPYYAESFDGQNDDEIYRKYFEETLVNLKKNSNYDVAGHLDYVVRYGKNKDRDYSYEKYKDVIDEILRTLIDKGKGLELNTGGLKSGLKDLHPSKDILKRYRELGGEIITIGSDAHKPENIGEYFDRACETLKDCGFNYYSVYEKRVAEFRKL
ncbi:MAG: histidinol-phosphatase HisJ family protein [Lachnospiraceae bacterium]|nr:histidinol-phosphatase HisJ family protein [Lachnospiraceae bacterium]